MSNLNLSNLKNNRNEILKAEIGALLFNLGKTHIGFWAEKNGKVYFTLDKNLFKQNFGFEPFSGYKQYYQEKSELNDKSPFEYELSKVNIKLKYFIFNNFVKFPFNVENNKDKIRWDSFFKGDALADREEGKEFIQKIFFRGCENINSGIDKGSPTKQLEILWISNAFGSFKGEVKEFYFDNTKLCFFDKLHRFLEDNNYYSQPNWEKIRNWILDEIKSWYSRLLSDSRFPANDVTLFDQAYMTASMFKAVLAGLFLEPSRYSAYFNNPQSIKWSILGVQYDRLGLAEKGLKAASIKWYRDAGNKVEDEIKKLIESEYVLGNEVYRDETGIYFVVAENIIGNKDEDFYKLNYDLDSIREKIQDIFSNNFEGEIYPAVFLTVPSRGLMNLGHLVEKAKENFLKAEYPTNFKEKLRHDSNPNGICQICGMRLANNTNKDDLICDVCKNRMEGRINKWVENPSDETIWIDELQDKNGRIALVTLKFELEKWLNGDLLNSLMIQQESFQLQIDYIQNFIYLFLSTLPVNFRESSINEKITKIINELKAISDRNKKKELGRLKGKLESLKRKIENIKNLIEQIRSSNWFKKQLNKDLGIVGFTGKDFDGIFSEIEKLYNQIKNEYEIEVLENISLFIDKLSSDAYNGCKRNNETFNDYINQVFFGAIKGNIWEKLIKNSILNSVIDWQTEEIKWSSLTNEQIKFLSKLLLQFFLCKNPSPARLRRIWETTREFFEELESKIIRLADIREERQKRLVWNNIDIPDGEYKDGEILFWAKNKTVYLISFIEKINDKRKFNLKPCNNNSNGVVELSIDSAIEQSYQPYFTILKTTPISWQFIIPAENIPELIKNVQKEYYKNFKLVYGKLPLHIGIIIQNYKKPLYIGIQALRKIRRDGIDWKSLGKEISAEAFKSRQKESFHYQQVAEEISDCESYYSLFEKISGEGKYEFYLYPETKEKVWLNTTQNVADIDKFCIYPNAFDFEFLDTNTRRNDIYYNDKNGKRFLKSKNLRPYDLDDWQYFEKFKDFFSSDKKATSKLHKLVSLIYSKLADWEDVESLQRLMISSFVNVLELKDNAEKNDFAQILGVERFNELKEMYTETFKGKLLMLIDMFEFWHTALKEV